MGGGFFRKVGLTAAFAAMAAATPALAQFSDSYTFLKAVKERDGEKATGFLNQPGTTVVNTRDRSTGETALHYVVQRRDAVWTKFLIGRGANVNVTDRNGISPLTLAASLGFLEGLEVLIAKGAAIDGTNSAGETPLISAVHRRDIPVIRMLIKHGANPDRSDNSGRSAREYANLMGASAGVLSEIERAEADRKSAGKPQETYGPGL